MSFSNTHINFFINKAYSANFFVLRKLAQTLSVSQRIRQLLSRLKQSNVVMVVRKPSFDKTTQLPKAILLDDELKKTGTDLSVCIVRYIDLESKWKLDE